MLLKQLMEVFDILDDSQASGEKMKNYLHEIAPDCKVEVLKLTGPEGKSTDVIRIYIPGKSGKMNGGTAPTLGIIGRLGGLGARPVMTGFVSDGDGALASLTAAAKLLDMQKKGDALEGDVIVATHICPDAPTQPHEPVPFMGSPVEMLRTMKPKCFRKWMPSFPLTPPKETVSSTTAALPFPIR